MKSALRSAQGMEQLRHRLMNISPEGQRCSVDQKTLKRTDLDDFVNCYFGRARPLGAPQTDGPAVRPYQSRHERKETERFQELHLRRANQARQAFEYLSNVPGFPRHTQSLGASRA